MWSAGLPDWRIHRRQSRELVGIEFHTGHHPFRRLDVDCHLGGRNRRLYRRCARVVSPTSTDILDDGQEVNGILVHKLHIQGAMYPCGA